MRLHEQVIYLKKKLKVYEEGTRDLYEYVTSQKFQGFENRSVNTSDIILRLEEIEENLIRGCE